MRWAELRMCRFWAGGISSFPFSRAREYRRLRRLFSRLHDLLSPRPVTKLKSRVEVSCDVS